MRELSLFSGAGGGLLGTKLLGWKHCGYVEYNDYCQRVIRQRILDGILENAPIFGDIRAFIDEGYAASYQGMVDVVTAGFPCQPFSVAGKQRGEDDERNMWPQTLAVLRTVRPRYALLENVPGLLAHEYARRIFADLAESGFNARWRVLSAAELGAPHKRDRWFCIATDASGTRTRGKADARQSFNSNESSSGMEEEWGKVADADVKRLQGATCREFGKFPEKAGAQQRGSANGGGSTGRGSWETEPDVGRVVDGVANGVDRLKALGNGQVPAVVRAAWGLLTE